MIAAREQKEISDTVSGISKNDISMELTKIQEEIRQKESEDVNEESETNGDKKRSSWRIIRTPNQSITVLENRVYKRW